MNIRYKIFFSLFLVSFSSVVLLAYSQDKFNLKPGAKGKLCMNCHDAFQEKLKSAFVHTPVRAGECSGCHNPHASTHGKMLASDTNKICFNCHKEIIPEKSRSSHKVVLEGNCVRCHDPHGSNNKFNLLKSGNELCFSCHKDLEEVVKKAKVKHNPVEKGCLNCHNPHASTKSEFLLKEEIPAICLKCHSGSGAAFLKQHVNYPVASARCNTCHNSHGSDKPKLLFNNIHKPVGSKMCSQCHEDSGSQNPFKTKKAGSDLCKGCHTELVNEIKSKKNIHPALDVDSGCLNCHNAHASTQRALLKGETLFDVCGKCHTDVIVKQGKSPAKHPPVRDGDCIACHSPHASDAEHLAQQPSIIALCGGCHDWQGHTAHPMGDNVPDPRDKTRTVNCLSCHKSHGTEFNHMLLYPTTVELCTKCHTQYQR